MVDIFLTVYFLTSDIQFTMQMFKCLYNPETLKLHVSKILPLMYRYHYGCPSLFKDFYKVSVGSHYH